MKNRTPLRYVGRLFKLLMIGSFVMSRTASGEVTPDEDLNHELAWMSVRDGLSREAKSADKIPLEVNLLVDTGFGGDLEKRIRASYLAISPTNVAQLDTMWMNSFLDQGADTETVDRFLRARSGALDEVAQKMPSAMDRPEKWRAFVRDYKVAAYSDG